MLSARKKYLNKLITMRSSNSGVVNVFRVFRNIGKSDTPNRQMDIGKNVVTNDIRSRLNLCGRARRMQRKVQRHETKLEGYRDEIFWANEESGQLSRREEKEKLSGCFRVIFSGLHHRRLCRRLTHLKVIGFSPDSSIKTTNASFGNAIRC